METIVPVIETRGLTKTYKGVQALQALDMEVTPNSICGFLDVMERLRCKIDARTLSSHPYRAILTLRTSDQHTPGGQRRIKDRWPETRIVLTSMVATHRAEALAAGADAFLLKGEPGETLATAILGKL